MALGLAAACRSTPPASAPRRPSVANAPRLSMAALHASGGVPPGWRFTPPPGDPAAGRRLFADLGCPACHAVRGERFAAPTGPGPELTGMGSHHPPGYFAESIVNPDAVLVDGPGYIGPDGHSIMPMYPDLTVGELADLVAYLGSLTSGVEASAAPPPGMGAPLPAPPDTRRRAFLRMAYDVLPGQLAAFERWFKEEGAPGFLAFPGLLAIDTYVDRLHMPAVTTLLAFSDEAALQRFLADPAMGRLGLAFDRFIGDHDHQAYAAPPPLYRVPSLSAP
jgi:mono/diheme cytochrome c family protein